MLKNPEGLLRRAALPPEPPLSQSPEIWAVRRRARLAKTLWDRREMAKPGYHQNLVIACLSKTKLEEAIFGFSLFFSSTFVLLRQAMTNGDSLRKQNKT